MKALRLIPLTLFVLVAACGGDPPDKSAKGEKEAGERPVVFAVNYPLAYFAERIGGDAIRVKFLAPPDEDPAFWRPADDEIAQIQKADLILRNGAGYAKWAAGVSLPSASQVDTSAAFKDQLIEVRDGASHSHGKEGEHDHGGVAFTTWIDLRQAIHQAEAVRDALKRVAGKNGAGFDANFEKLRAELEVLDAKLVKVAGLIGEQPLVVSHPVYQYFGRRYGLNIKSVHWEPETVPDEDAMTELEKIRKVHPAKWMIWEGEPEPESVSKLEETGVKSLVFDPCGNRPEEGDFLRVMEKNVAALEATFAE